MHCNNNKLKRASDFSTPDRCAASIQDSGGLVDAPCGSSVDASAMCRHRRGRVTGGSKTASPRKSDYRHWDPAAGQVPDDVASWLGRGVTGAASCGTCADQSGSGSFRKGKSRRFAYLAHSVRRRRRAVVNAASVIDELRCARRRSAWPSGWKMKRRTKTNQDCCA